MSFEPGQKDFSKEMERARQRFDALYARLAAGEFDQASFEAARQGLVTTDAQGRYWTPDAEGRWLWYDGAQWVERPAPVATALRARAGEPRGATRGRAQGQRAAHPKAPLGRVLALAAIFFLALVGGVVALGLSAPDLEPKLVQLDQPLGVDPIRYQLSAAQEELIQRHGDPDGFIILFYDEEGAARPTRQETWAWYEAGLSVTMIDGEPTGSSDLPPSKGVYAAPYRPNRFTGNMTLEEVLAAAQITEYVVAPLENELVPDAEAYFADQIAFGLKDGHLLYIEGIALVDAQE